jgi:hypothetical protein
MSNIERDFDEVLPFTAIPNKTLRDSNLSFQASGLLAHLLSLPPNWKVSVRQLSTVRAKNGDASVRAALKELQSEGYVRLTRNRNPDGTICAPEWKVRSTPYPTNQGPEKPCVENPHVDNSDVDNRSTIKERVIKEVSTKEISLSKDDEVLMTWIEEKLKEHPEMREKVELYQHKPVSYRQKVLDSLIEKKSLRSLQGNSSSSSSFSGGPPPSPQKRTVPLEESIYAKWGGAPK